MTVSIPNPGEELKPLAISTNGHTPAAFAAKMIVPELTSESLPTKNTKNESSRIPPTTTKLDMLSFSLSHVTLIEK
jgi:hypothetical protein